jgi:hypothetical protein
LLLFSTLSYGQFKKGSVLLGGDVSFGMSKTENLNNPTQKTNAFTFSPVFAKATRDNLFIGGSLSLGVSKSIFNVNGEAKTQTYYMSVFARRYKSIFGKINAFVQGGISGGRIVTKNMQGVDYKSEGKGVSVFASITPGISVSVSKKLFLEAGFSNIAAVSYDRNKETGYNFGSTIDRKNSSFSFSSSLSTSTGGLFFGARFILPK